MSAVESITRPALLASRSALPNARGIAAADASTQRSVDGTRQTAPAAARSEGAGLSSAKLAIASMLGVVTYPLPATIKVNGRTIAVDLEFDSLSSIAARVLSEARPSDAVRPADDSGSMRYRLAVEREGETAASAEPATQDADRPRMVERFTTLDAAMQRVREQAAPLAVEVQALPAEPHAG